MGYSNGVGHEHQMAKRQLPSVGEALQYSPLTSSLPFNHDLIHHPCVPATIIAAFPINAQQKHEYDKKLEALVKDEKAASEKASQAPGAVSATSEQLEQTLNDLRQLLNTDELTQYKFTSRLPPVRPRAKLPTDSTAPPPTPAPRKPRPKLDLLAKQLLKKVNIPYEYDPPEQIKTKVPAAESTSHVNGNRTPIKAQSVTPKPSIVIKNEQSFNQNNDGMNSTPEVSFPTVMIPTSSENFGDIQYDPQADAQMLEDDQLSRKRKRESEEQDLQVSFVPSNFERQERQQAAVDALQEYAEEILVAENTGDPKYFVSQGDDSILAGFAISRCEVLLTKVRSARAANMVSVEFLTGIQSLCKKALNSADGIDVELPDDVSDEQLDIWTTKVQVLCNSIRASKTLARLMLLDREEKQLYSQEIIQTILSNYRRIFETLILPLVEKRAPSDLIDAIRQKAELKNELSVLLDQLGRLLKLLGDLVENLDVVESSISSLEWMATQLVFAENPGTEKESILGSQKFEVVRQYAMESLTKIFLRCPDQRRSMLKEVLASLERLPVNRQSARHFKVIDGKPIQLASAMIMQFIQISTIRATQKAKAKGSAVDEHGDDDEASSYHENSDDDNDDGQPSRKVQKTSSDARASIQLTSSSAVNNLTKVAAPLYEAAQRNAIEVAKHLIERALNSTKSGDAPFRNLLDIFTEDFLSVLGSTDWPAAEWLLQALLSSLITIMDDNKRPVPAKTMALDLMGSMGSGVSDIQIYVSKAVQNLEMGNTLLGKDLRDLCDEALDYKPSPGKVIGRTGPYRVIAEFLQNRDLGSIQLRSARCYFVSQWARHIKTSYEHMSPDLDEADVSALKSRCESVSIWLRQVIDEPGLMIHHAEFDKISTAEARLCYALTVLNMPFCRAQSRILSILLTSLSSPHATIRSKSLKSIIQLLEKDPAILDRGRDVMGHILRCSVDSSPLVRDSALGLIGKVISLKPALEEKALKPLISRSGDAAPGVRKRAMRLLKDIYARNHTQVTRAAIAEAILQRVTDAEDSVCEQAKTIIEEIWFSPFYQVILETEVPIQARKDLFAHICLIVATLQHGAETLVVLEALFKEAMNDKTKNVASNRSVCELLVATLFDAIIDNDESPGRPSQRNMLQTLTVFAKANPNLFTANQMHTLRPYIENLSTSDDLILYRSVVVIYRSVLPVLPPLQHDFLRGVQDVLFKSVQRIPKVELQEVAACMWIINSVLQNTDKLANLTLSVLAGILKAQKAPKLEYERLKRYIILAGSFGKAFDLDSYLSSFKEKLPLKKVDSVSAMIVEITAPFSAPEHPEFVRKETLDCICRIGQSWPKVFLKAVVTTTFQTAFDEKSPALELTILEGFQEFYRLEEHRSKTGTVIPVGEGAATGGERLGKSLVQADSDGAATSIAQRFLPHIIRNALGSTGEVATIAAEVISSTNRQGLVHPKECCGALVALETSPVPTVAKIAFEEHRNLHHKHESMMEKEYLRAIERAFVYQRDTIKSLSGIDSKQAPKLGLFFEGIQGGSAGLRKKLLANICSRVNFDATNLNKIIDLDYHLDLSRFLLENLSFFEYGRVDEVLQVITSCEKIFTTTGNKLSQQIEAKLHVKLQAGVAEESNPGTGDGFNGSSLPNNAPPAVPISAALLRKLASASVVLSLVWETRGYLRRAWNVQSLARGSATTAASKTKPAAKDLNRAPIKAQNVSSDKHLEAISKTCASLMDEEGMKTQCRTFVEQLNVDNELKIEEEDRDADNGMEEDGPMRFHTPGSEGRSDRGSVPPSGGSRYSKSGTPSKIRTGKRGRPPGSTNKRKSMHGSDEEDDGGGGGDADDLNGWA